MNRRRMMCSMLAAALVSGAGACGRSEAPAPQLPEVGVVVARLGVVPDRREYVGNVEAVNRVEVRARVRGYLVDRSFVEGSRVSEGDALFRIDPSTYQVALDEARARLSRARADAERTRLDFERTRELFASKVASTAAYDARRSDYDAARAEEQSAEAAVRAAELDLSWCTVRAPLTGRVGRAQVDVGNLVGGAGQDTLLAEIVQVDPVHVLFAPTERERLEVMRGAREGRLPAERAGAIPVQIRLGDGEPYPHEGIVDYVDPTIDPTRGTITVRARVPNPEGDLKPGEFVRVVAVFPDRADAVLVPQRAVLDEQGGTYVLVVGDGDIVAQRRVQIGAVAGALQHVTTGLAVGERVIVEGVQKARPGGRVTPKPVDDAAAPAT